MNSFCRRSISQLRRASQTTTTKTHRIFLLNLHSHYATKTTTKPSKPLKPKTPVTDSAPPLPRSWTVFSSKPTDDSLSPSPLPSPAEWARPSEIPFQAKVANSVHLVGYVRAPVRFHITPDGSSWSSTVITQNISSENDHHDDHGDDEAFPESLPLCIRVPIIFEGDLAHVAASHLKENDRVYVTGKLSASLPHLNANQVQASIQVLAHDLNFIGEAVQTIKSSMPYKQEKGTRNNSDRVNKDKSDLSSWMGLLENPKQWWDNRDRKRNRLVSPKYPDFTHKDDRRGLWLDTAPQSVLVELEGLQLDAQIRKSTEDKQLTVYHLASTKKDGDSASWRDLIDNSEKWWDYRHSKLDGLVNPKFPDFKRKDGSLSLWLSSAPQWVSSQLAGLKFDVKIQKPKAAVKASKDELWKDLVEHPEKWWDNRLQKLNRKHPDFKHKETGEALWLGGSPTWVLSKLPPPKSKKAASFGKRDTLLS